MFQKGKSLIREFFLRDPADYKFWLFLTFVTKGLMFLFLISKSGVNPIEGFWGNYGGDTNSYIDPIENLIGKGKYSSTNRMPGMALFYLPLYYFFSKAVALNLFILFQFIFTVVSTYFLALIAYKAFKSSTYFYWTFYLFAISIYSNLFDAMVLTESFTCSFLIMSVYAVLKWDENKRNFWLLLSGAFLTEVIFLKPVFLPSLFLYIIFVVRQMGFSKGTIKPVMFFLLSFIIIDGAWTLRNYKLYRKFVPLTPGLYHLSPDNLLAPLADFMQSFGGNSIYWDAGAEARWFGWGLKNVKFGKGVDTGASLPSDIYTSKFNNDSLQIIRDKYMVLLYDSTISKAVYEEHKSYIFSKLKIYSESIKQERKILYYIKAPLRLVKIFFIHSGTYNLFEKSSAELNKLELLVKIFYSLFYVMILVLGFFGLCLLFRKSIGFEPVALITGIVSYTAVIHPIILRFCEARYFLPAWPFLIICGVYALLWIRNKLNFVEKES